MCALLKVIVEAGVILLAITVQTAAELSRDLKPRVSSGIVTTSDTGFVLDGKPFSFGGTNAYWANSLANEDIASLFSQMNSAGLGVLRIFGWSDNVGSPEDDSFQSWSGSSNYPNAAAFQTHMDPVVSAAEAAGIKLVVPMIGNWGPSINLYIQQILGSDATHDTFFSNADLVAAYKTYVSFFVNRYKDSPAIFAWELMNEPRCTGDDNRGASSSCDTGMITSWIKEMSAYIKAVDPNHMVTVGDEGWFTPAQGYGTSSPYSGDIGIDWVTNLGIESIDYGTVHLYPDSWGEDDSWGSTWITQHGAQAKIVGKPVVLEEFGTTDVGDRQSVVNDWLSSAYTSGFGGFQFWQFVSSFPSGYTSPDDGNGISTTEATYSTIKSFAAKFRSGSMSTKVVQTSSAASSGSASPVAVSSAVVSSPANSVSVSACVVSFANSGSANASSSIEGSRASGISVPESSTAIASSASSSPFAHSQSASSVSSPSSTAPALTPAGSESADAEGYILPLNGTASTTQFVLGTELAGGTACGMDALPSGTSDGSPGGGPGYLYAAINQLAFGANPAGKIWAWQIPL